MVQTADDGKLDHLAGFGRLYGAWLRRVFAERQILRERNRNIRSRVRLGKRQWHTKSGYSRRSMVENAIYRYKTIIGTDMRSRNLACQRVEARIGWKILNTMTDLGMPQSYRVG